MDAAAAALKRSGFDVLFDGHPDPAWVYDRGQDTYRVNRRLVAATGFSAAEAEKLLDVMPHPEDRGKAAEAREAAIRGLDRQFRARARTKSGREFLVDTTLLPLRAADGAVVGVLGIAKDVTELTAAVDRTQRTETMLRVAGTVAGVAGWTIDAATGLLEVTEGIDAIRGTSVPAGLRWDEYVRRAVPGDSQRAIVLSAFQRSLRTGEPVDVTVRLPQPGTASIVIRLVGEAVRGVGGQVERLIGAYCDVTAVVDGETRARQLEQRLTSRLDQMGVGIGFLDRDWRFTYVNETGQRYLHNSAEALNGASLWDLYPEAWDTPFGEIYRQAMDERVAVAARDFYPPFQRWFEARAFPIEDGIAIQLLDVTEDQENRALLEATTARLRAQAELLDAAHDAMIVRTVDGRFVYGNRSAEQTAGRPLKDLEGQRVADLLYADRAAYERAEAAVLRAGQFAGDLRRRHRDGRVLLMDCRWQLMRDGSGAPSTIFAVETDVTEWRRDEEQRYRDQRLESLGALAGGIAHDLNNVLTPVVLGAQLLAADEADPRRRALLASVEAGSTRAAQLIRQLLQFARGEGGARRALDVAALLEEAASFAKEALPKAIAVSVLAEPDVPRVAGDATQLFQVLMNLTANAGDAMPDGGILQLTAATSPADPGLVAIAVTDSGAGMDGETAARVFEPFFTTKELGRGTGLGLSTSLAIVRSHGGTLQVESVPGAGSTFTLHLPAAAHVPEAGAEPSAPSRAGAGELVLLVDDDAEVRRFAEVALTRSGYEVLAVGDGRSAVDLVERAAVDLLLVDMTMAGMGGAETAARARAVRAGLPVVAMSGFDAEAAASRADHRFASFLPKPFAVDDLLRAVAAALPTADR